jgi:hypothetical protein
VGPSERDKSRWQVCDESTEIGSSASFDLQLLIDYSRQHERKYLKNKALLFGERSASPPQKHWL